MPRTRTIPTPFRHLLAALALLLAAGAAVADGTDSHTVTVVVSAVNELAIDGGDVTLTVDSATAGSDLDTATDDTTASLLWTTNEAGRKITVQSSLDSLLATYDLTVTATSVSGGTAAGAVTPSLIAQDFVTGISNTTGSAALSYRVAATAADGVGSDEHTITYTITSE